MPLSVRFSGVTIKKPGSYTIVDVTKLSNINLGEQGVVGVVGEATSGQPSVAMVFDDPRDMITELVGGNLAEMAQALFFPGKDATLQGAKRVVVVKTNQSTQASRNLNDGAAVTQIVLRSRVWGAPGNFAFASLAAGTAGGVVLSGGRDTDPLAGQVQSLAEVGRTSGTPNIDSWLMVWFDLSLTTSTHLTATVTYNPNADSLISTMGGGAQGNAGTLNFTAGNDGALSTHTVETLIATINTKLGWRATLLRPNRLKTSARQGDTTSAPINVHNVGPVVGTPANFWDFMGGVFDLTDAINTTSVFFEATKTAVPPATTQLPANFAKAYLAGGTLGVSSSTNIQDALKLLLKSDVRCLASGFSRDVGATTIGTINGYIKSNVQSANAVTGRSERYAYASDGSLTTRAAVEAAANALNEPDMALCVQTGTREDELGVVKAMDPHIVAATAAGLRAGGPVGMPLTNKLVRFTNIGQTGWDPSDLTDAEALITAGLLHMEIIPGLGIRFVRDRTTYSTLDNDALTAGEIRDEIRLLKQALRNGIEALFVGTKSLGVITANAAKARAEAVLGVLADPGSADVILVSGTDQFGNVVPPFRNVKVSISQDTLSLSAEVTFAQGINFNLNQIFAAPLLAVV